MDESRPIPVAENETIPDAMAFAEDTFENCSFDKVCVFDLKRRKGVVYYDIKYPEGRFHIEDDWEGDEFLIAPDGRLYFDKFTESKNLEDQVKAYIEAQCPGDDFTDPAGGSGLHSHI